MPLYTYILDMDHNEIPRVLAFESGSTVMRGSKSVFCDEKAGPKYFLVHLSAIRYCGRNAVSAEICFSSREEEELYQMSCMVNLFDCYPVPDVIDYEPNREEIEYV